MIWKWLRHVHVCPFYGVWVDDAGSQYALVSPWMPNGDLVHYLKNHPDIDRTQMAGYRVSQSRYSIHNGHLSVGRSGFRPLLPT